MCDWCNWYCCHLYCCRPVLTEVPEGNWYCKFCNADSNEEEVYRPNYRSRSRGRGRPRGRGGNTTPAQLTTHPPPSNPLSAPTPVPNPPTPHIPNTTEMQDETSATTIIPQPSTSVPNTNTNTSTSQQQPTISSGGTSILRRNNGILIMQPRTQVNAEPRSQARNPLFDSFVFRSSR